MSLNPLFLAILSPWEVCLLENEKPSSGTLSQNDANFARNHSLDDLDGLLDPRYHWYAQGL